MESFLSSPVSWGGSGSSEEVSGFGAKKQRQRLLKEEAGTKSNIGRVKKDGRHIWSWFLQFVGVLHKYYEHVMVLLKLKKELMTDEVSFRAIIAAVKCYNKRYFAILKLHFVSFSHWKLYFSKLSKYIAKCIPAMPAVKCCNKLYLIFP